MKLKMEKKSPIYGDPKGIRTPMARMKTLNPDH